MRVQKLQIMIFFEFHVEFGIRAFGIDKDIRAKLTVKEIASSFELTSWKLLLFSQDKIFW